MTPEEQIDLATELWAIAQAPTTEIGIEGVTQLMIPVIAAYTAAVEAKERERTSLIVQNILYTSPIEHMRMPDGEYISVYSVIESQLRSLLNE